MNSRKILGLAAISTGTMICLAMSLRVAWPQRTTFEGHTDTVLHVISSPDGRTLASVSSDETVRLWNVNTRKERAILGIENPVGWSVAFSPDSKTFASAGYKDKTIKLWDVDTGRERAKFQGLTHPLDAVAFSPDGKTLASTDGDKCRTIKLWDMDTREERAALRGHNAHVHSLAFSPDGKTLASGDHDKTIKLWEVATGKERLTVREDAWFVFAVPFSPPCVAFSPDGKTLASWGNMTIKLWDTTTGTKRTTLSDSRWCSEYNVESVVFSPDGKQLASLFGQIIDFWDVASGRNLVIFDQGYHPHPLRKAFGAMGDKVVDTLPKVFKEYDHDYVRSISVRPDGKVVALGCGDSKDGTVKMWTVATFPYSE